MSTSYADGGVGSSCAIAAYDPSVAGYRDTSPSEWGGLFPMDLIAQTLADGLVLGGIYALAAVGFSLVFGVLLGVALARNERVKSAVGPLILGLSSVPSICWLPLAAVC